MKKIYIYIDGYRKREGEKQLREKEKPRESERMRE